MKFMKKLVHEINDNESVTVYLDEASTSLLVLDTCGEAAYTSDLTSSQIKELGLFLINAAKTMDEEKSK
jgi:hypothetical protein